MDTPIRVLLIDDEADYLRSISKVLCRKGFEISTALGGYAALAMLKQNQFDIVLTDMKMPELDGLATIEAIRAQGYSMPILILSGIADFVKVSSALKHGIVDFISKPCPMEELIFAIESAHERHQYAKMLL